MPLRGLISATFQRGNCVVVMNEITNGTADAARGKIFITRGTVDSTRGSGDAMNGNVYTTRRTVHSARGFADATRGIVDSMRGSAGVTHGKNDNVARPAWRDCSADRAGNDCPGSGTPVDRSVPPIHVSMEKTVRREREKRVSRFSTRAATKRSN